MMSTTNPNPKKSIRTCAGCSGHEAPEGMVRVVRGPDGELGVDLAGGAFGRGAHVHPACIESAFKGGFARTFKAQVKSSSEELSALVRDACDRRLAGLLLGARRAGHVIVGADAACKAIDAGAFALVAVDAGTIARRVTTAVSEGRAVAWGTKALLGELFGEAEVAIAAVTHPSLASTIQRCVVLKTAAGKTTA
jgi:predicted RNA-binding protein YlxR (DUF448 family)